MIDSRGHIHTRLAWLALGAGCALLGCDSGQAAKVRPLVRDSAGVTIISNESPAWSDGEGWRVAETPVVDIGVVSGDAAYELFRPLGALRLSDGRIVVANAGTSELRYYDERGKHLGSSGGRGGGPGEFFAMSWFARTDDDSVVVYDRRSRRVSLFDPDGRYHSSVALPGGDFPSVQGRLSDGSYLARVVPRRARDAPPEPLGRGRDSLSFLRYGPDGEFLDTLGVFLRRIKHGLAFEFMGRSRRGAMTIPFTPSTVLAVAGSKVIVGTSTSYQISQFTPDGVLIRLIRKRHSRLPVEPSDVDSFLDSLRAQYATGGPEAKTHVKMNEETPPADSMPAFDDLIVDREGNLWVSASRHHGDPSVQWDVFDTEGIWLGVVPGPDGFRVTDIGSDYLLGLWKDDLEVEHALLYELIKS
ncbi:MAG: hypothetical protein IH876_13730 [Gemmatimonadetes bacterium]|nr:hypothetical protein [Gemmatimonadota bacterium]